MVSSFDFANDAHAGQVRKYTGEPYITHPICVLKILEEFASEILDANPFLRDVTLLHDVVEDTDVDIATIVSVFGQDIGEGVDSLTDCFTKQLHPELNRAQRKDAESDRLSKIDQRFQYIKIADLIHNAQSIRENDPSFWRAFRHEALNLLHKFAPVVRFSRIGSELASELSNSDNLEYDSVMLDLETMAVGPNAAVVQIGAIAFNLETGVRGPDVFLIDVDTQSCVELGGEIHPSTLHFWEKLEGFKPHSTPQPIMNALMALQRWFEDRPDVKRVWSQGPSFDVAIMEGYFLKTGLMVPWRYSDARDTRTVYDLANGLGWQKPAGTESTHNALGDCDRQIICLLSALEVL